MYLSHIKALGLPEPLEHETQVGYIKRLLLNGYTVNTRQCRYIGVGNLHSLISHLKKYRFPHTVEHKRVADPVTGAVPVHPVDVVYMTAEQVERYKKSAQRERLSA